MSFKLPDGTEVDCTLVQARRVWEICASRHNCELEMLGDGILIKDPGYTVPAGRGAPATLSALPHLVMPNGQVFNANPRFQEPPLPMESEKPPEVSEFHRGVITAIETIWKHKFTSAAWTWEVQDILARAAADGKVNGLATLLETIATTDIVEHVLDAVYRLRPPQPKSEDSTKSSDYVEGFRRSKIHTIKLLWQDRFGDAALDGCLNILSETWHRHADSVDDFLQHLTVAQWTREGLIGEIERFEKLNDSWRKAGGK